MPAPGSPPTQTPAKPETDQTQLEVGPEMQLYGFSRRMQRGAAIDHDADQAPGNAPESTTGTTTNSQPNIGLGSRVSLEAGATLTTLATIAMLAPGGAEASNQTSRAEVEKQANAAFSNNAITRSVESFPKPASALRSRIVEASARIGVSNAVEVGSKEGNNENENFQGAQGTNQDAGLNQSDNGFRQLCTKLGLAMPNVNARMVRPGNDGGLPQAIYIDLVYRYAKSFAQTCKGKFIQVRQVLVQMQTKNRKGWLNLATGGRITKKKYWKNIKGLDEEGKDKYDIIPAGHPEDRLWNRTCRATRAFIRNRVLSSEKRRIWVKGRNGRKGHWSTRYPVVGQRTKIEPVRVGGKCAK